MDEDGRKSKNQRRKRTTHNKLWTGPNFRTDNFRHHLLEQHPSRWKEYQELRNKFIEQLNTTEADHSSSTLLSPLSIRYQSFFITTCIPAYFSVDAEKKEQAVTFNIGKEIIETLILGLLFDSE